jgi:2-dehydropantoate 2-reductase
MRVLVVRAGVIGSVYGAKLLEAGHAVVMLSRGERLADLQTRGLMLQDGESQLQTRLSVPAVDRLDDTDGYDLALVSVRHEQLAAALPVLTSMRGRPDVLVFGHSSGRRGDVLEALGNRAVFGFPAVGGIRDGRVIRYVLIRQQKSMLGEPGGATSSRILGLRAAFRDAGFPTRISTNIDGWLIGHVAFVVPIAFALYRVGIETAQLARDSETLALMVRATRQAFGALLAGGDAEIPTNLKILYMRMPEAFAVRYWRRVLAGPRGELWFAAHSRAAPEELRSLRDELVAAVRATGHSAPALKTLLSAS